MQEDKKEREIKWARVNVKTERSERRNNDKNKAKKNNEIQKSHKRRRDMRVKEGKGRKRGRIELMG